MNISPNWLKQLEKELRGKSVDEFLKSGPHTHYTQAKPYNTQLDTTAIHSFIQKKDCLNLTDFDQEFRTLTPVDDDVLQLLQSGSNAIYLKQFSQINWDEISADYLLTVLEKCSVQEAKDWLKMFPKPVSSHAFHLVLKNEIVDHAFLSLGKENNHAKTININAAAFGNAGADIETEILAALLKAKQCIQKGIRLGFTAHEVAQQIAFTFSVDTQLIPSLVKFQTFRYLWASVLAEFTKEIAAFPAYILAESNPLCHDQIDPYNNLLRTTLQAFICMTTPVTAFHTIPFDEENKALGKHAVKNISLLLENESFLTKVKNPLSGSYSLEQFSFQVVESIWEKYKMLKENEQAFDEVNKMCQNDAKELVNQLNSGAIKLVGANVFNQSEKTPSWKLTIREGELPQVNVSYESKEVSA